MVFKIGDNLGNQYSKGRVPYNKKIFDNERIISLYSELKSCDKVAKIMGCHLSSIYRILKKFNINTSIANRPKSPEQIQKFIETNKRLYAEGKRVVWNIHKERTLEERKRMSATRQGITIEQWNGFTHLEGHDDKFINRFKRAIRKRDNYVCIICGIHSEKLNESLCIHHVDYNKKLTIPQNCVSLCRSCHSRTNQDRK